MTWHNTGVFDRRTRIYISIFTLYFYLDRWSRAFQILSSTERMVVDGVLRLVIKYATSPSVLKFIPNGAPPGAVDKNCSSRGLGPMELNKVWADFEL